MITKEEIQHLLHPQERTFWGEKKEGNDVLVEESHGDGNQLMYLGTGDSRPWLYLIRIDSSVDLDNLEKADDDCLEEYGYGFLDRIFIMIAEEFDDIDDYDIELEDGRYTNEQDIKHGYPPVDNEFPMLSAGNGHFYGQHSFHKNQI